MPNLSSSEFHSELKDWGYWKHEILNKYMHVWVSKLAWRRKELAFVDAFAGVGHYEDNSDGSPVIAAKWNSHKLLEEKRLIVYACEADPDSAIALASNMAPWTSMDPPRAVVYDSSFEDAMPEIMELTKTVPTLFFIDPCGTKDITIPKLRPLLEQEKRGPTEILLRIDPVMLSRFAGWVKAAERDAKKQKTSSKMRELLRQLNVDVDTIAASEEQPWMEDLLGQYLEAFYKRFKYVQLVPIRADYFAAPKYYMVHGTDSPDGCAKVNDVLSTTEDALFEKTATEDAGAQTLLFAPTRTPRVTIRDAKEFVFELLDDNGLTQFVEICAQLAMRFGPDLREKHHKKAVKELLEEKKILRGDSGAITRTTALRLPTRLEVA
jgi:three-Cys-motif partner protein